MAGQELKELIDKKTKKGKMVDDEELDDRRPGIQKKKIKK